MYEQNEIHLNSMKNNNIFVCIEIQFLFYFTFIHLHFFMY